MPRPFRIEINMATGERRTIELTDEEIADAQRRTAEEQTARQARQAAEDRRAAMMAYLEELYDNRLRPR